MPTAYDFWKTLAPEDEDLPDEFIEGAIELMQDEILEKARDLYWKWQQQQEMDVAADREDLRRERRERGDW